MLFCAWRLDLDFTMATRNYTGWPVSQRRPAFFEGRCRSTTKIGMNVSNFVRHFATVLFSRPVSIDREFQNFPTRPIGRRQNIADPRLQTAIVFLPTPAFI
jgi:hypothetical protein